MTQPAKVQEPSMEEILASIRRIIADDEAKPPPAAEKPAAQAAAPAPAPVAAQPPKQEKPAAAPPPKSPAANDLPPPKSAPAVAAKPVAAPPPPAPKAAAAAAPAPAPVVSNSQDDIDALLSGLDEATTEDEIRPAPAPEPDADVFELTDDMAVPSVAPPAQPSFQKVEPDDDLEFAESVASRTMQRPPVYAPSSPPAFEPPPGPPSPAILSNTTVTAVESAFNSLAHTVLSNNARTLEDLVKEMLRPMLKSWLDDNLPGLVERIVKAEIERVSRGR
jgi:uncharacterized protein